MSDSVCISPSHPRPNYFFCLGEKGRSPAQLPVAGTFHGHSCSWPLKVSTDPSAASLRHNGTTVKGSFWEGEGSYDFSTVTH